MAECLESRTLLSSYIISTSGSDSADGLTDATAWRTLQRAADVKPGDTVTVRPGTYAGLRYTGSGGTQAAPITFKADPGVTINDGGTDGANAGFHFESGSPGYFVIDGFKIDGSNGSMPKAGIRLIDAHDFVIRNCDISNPAGMWGIFIFSSTDGLVENNLAHDSGQLYGGEHGIYLSGYCHRITVRHNSFYNNAKDGIHTNAYSQPGPATGLVLDGNVIYGNGLSGMDIEGMQDSMVTNNVIFDNGKHGITVHHVDNLPNYPSRSDVFANNTILSRDKFAIQLGQGNTQNYVLNNVLISNSPGNYGAIGTDNETAGLVSDYNAVTDSFSTTLGISRMSLAAWRSQTGQDQHSFVATAADLFVDPAGNDYHLAPDSPAIDAGAATLAGTPAAAPALDVDDETRPQGPAYDIGADEYAAPGTPDTTPPTISSVAATNLTTSGATIRWTTDEGSSTLVEYGATDTYGSSTPLNTTRMTQHAAALSGLAPETTYHYRVTSTDRAGNTAVSGDFTFTTAAPDRTPPIISAVTTSNITSGGATVRWTTDEASTTQVEYGPTDAYGSSTPLNATRVTLHAATLSGLAPETAYHYRVKSTDAAGNAAVSGDFTFTTPPRPSQIFSPVPRLGDFANYAPLTASRWTVADDGSGDVRLFLNTTSYTEIGDSLLGEMAVAGGTSLGDFDITLKAKTGDNLTTNTAADYAVVFGYVDPNNYSYLMMNATTGFTTFMNVLNGVDQSYGTPTAAGIPDAAWHDVKVSRRGSVLTAWLDGAQVLTANDAALARVGAVGVGSFNDSAYFDDYNATPPPAKVVARWVFYNDSTVDDGTPAPAALDDRAVDLAKRPLLPGEGPASFANYTNYAKGINGLMIDVQNLPPGVTPSASDFDFMVGNTPDGSIWSDAPVPSSVTLRRGAGVDGSDRVTVVWPAGSIRNTWLRVAFAPGGATGLGSQDVFYLGNLVGDTGNAPAGARPVVDSRDLLALRRALLSAPAAVLLERYDFNRDGVVNVRDLLVARSNVYSSLAPLTAPAPTAAAARTAPAPRVAADVLGA